MYYDRKAIIYLWGRKWQLSHHFFKYQVLLTKLQNLKIIWSPGSNLVFPDILSWYVTIDENQQHQLEHQKRPRNIQFFNERGKQVTYKVNEEHSAAKTCNDFYPIQCHQGKDQKMLRLEIEAENFSINSISTGFTTQSVQPGVDPFLMEKLKNQFRHLCRSPFLVSLSPSESSIGNYSPISVFEAAFPEEPQSFFTC